MANKYYKLGVKARSFYDPNTGLNVKPKTPGMLTKPASKKVKNASAQGFIIEIKEDEYNELMEARAESQEQTRLNAKATLSTELARIEKKFGKKTLENLLTNSESVLSKTIEAEEAEKADEETPTGKVEYTQEELEDMDRDELIELHTEFGVTKKSLKNLSKDEIIEKYLSSNQ